MLGAGALQTVGLKTITAKHLMLVAQCLQVVILNINTIKNHFELRLTPKQYVMLTQFDQILKVGVLIFHFTALKAFRIFLAQVSTIFNYPVKAGLYLRALQLHFFKHKLPRYRSKEKM